MENKNNKEQATNELMKELCKNNVVNITLEIFQCGGVEQWGNHRDNKIKRLIKQIDD